VFAEHDPAAIAWRGEFRQRSLCANLDLPCASRAAELFYAVGVHGCTGAPVPQIAAARAEWVRSLDPDIARVEREGVAALDAVPLEALQEELRHRGPEPLQFACVQRMHCMLAYKQHRSEIWMTTLTIRNVDPALKEELRIRAARHGRSMEAELRHILKEALGGEKRAELNLAEAIRRRFAPLGGVDLELPPPEFVGEPPSFDS